MKKLSVLLGLLIQVDIYSAILYHSTYTDVGIIVGRIEDVTYRNKLSKVIMYLGIPYARSQNGVLRFQKPFAATPFERNFNATFYRPACSHYLPDIAMQMSEDCLTLNIYAPVESTINPTRKYPVLVYLHGGEFKYGTSQAVSPATLAYKGDIIVVTVNYRVGVLGFLTTGNEHMQGNYGLWDQHYAIKWIRFNIEAFGGDIERITVIGQDAGATSAILQGLYPGNRGLFQRLIVMSASPLNPWALTVPTAHKLGHKLGCMGDEEHVELDEYEQHNKLVKCLREIPEADLILASSTIKDIGPTIDGIFVTDHPQNILLPLNNTESDALQFFRSLDVVIGINDQDGDQELISILKSEFKLPDLDTTPIGTDEFEQMLLPRILSPYFQHQTVINNGSVTAAVLNNVRYSVLFQYTNWTDPENAEQFRSELLRLVTDITYGTPAIQLADAHAYSANKNVSTYFYQFAHKPSFAPIAPVWVTGAGHGAESMFMFGFPPAMIGSHNPRLPMVEFKLAENMMRWISNFAKTGNPNKPFLLFDDDSEWPKYNDTRPYLKMEGNFTAHTRFEEPRTSFWQTLVPAFLLNKDKCRPVVRPSFNGSMPVYFTAMRIPSDSVSLVIIVLICVVLLLLILLLIVSICLIIKSCQNLR